MAHYLVTGGAGFIGSNIVELLLKQGDRVRVLDDLSTGMPGNLTCLEGQKELIEGSICDRSACERAVDGVDYVLHQAAIPSVPRSIDAPLITNQANVTGTVNLLLAARDAGVKRFVYAASSAAYGNQEAPIKTEDLPPAPLSPYAAQKLAGEHYLRVFSECYGMETVSLRYFNVFGPRQDPDSPYSAVIPLFIRAMLRGESPTLHGDGLQSRDFTYVENNVRGNVLAATADYEAKGQVYNIACGESYTLIDLVRAINDALGTDIPPAFAPARVGDVRDSLADISRAKRDLGYDVTVGFGEGLKRTVAWYREALGA